MTYKLQRKTAYNTAFPCLENPTNALLFHYLFPALQINSARQFRYIGSDKPSV